MVLGYGRSASVHEGPASAHEAAREELPSSRVGSPTFVILAYISFGSSLSKTQSFILPKIRFLLTPGYRFSPSGTTAAEQQHRFLATDKQGEQARIGMASSEAGIVGSGFEISVSDSTTSQAKDASSFLHDFSVECTVGLRSKHAQYQHAF